MSAGGLARPARWRPYAAAFSSRFLQMLQYRAAALAGFATQCWWGGIKVMVLAAFYAGASGSAGGAAAMPLAQAITYTWIAQGLLALLPWAGDPEVAQAVRTGSVAYDRLRPVDAYGFWFARTAGWIAARMLPRLGLMLCFAALLLPLAGHGGWGWQPPAGPLAAALFAVSLGLALLLSIVVESAWEITENSPAVIEHYRSATISLDYYGDSVLNSVSDILSMVLGFLIAWALPVWLTVTGALAMELIVGWLIRDNLTLNVIMLLWPMDWIKAWQGGA